MTSDDDDDDGEGEETHHQRVSRELIELLNELRVALPGVQVLFAFLLTVPFSQRFTTVNGFERDVYFVTLLTAGLSSVLLITPSAQHRWLFRKHDKDQLLQRSNSYAIAGILCLAVALCSAVLFVTDFIFSRTTAIIVTAILAAVLLHLWVILPLRRRFTDVDPRGRYSSWS
jgi:hypothetical protein